jgi:hypothetical protein
MFLKVNSRLFNILKHLSIIVFCTIIKCVAFCGSTGTLSTVALRYAVRSSATPQALDFIVPQDSLNGAMMCCYDIEVEPFPIRYVPVWLLQCMLLYRVKYE